MNNMLAPYESQFTIEERKRLVAQTIAQLRRGSGLSQKEAAAQVGISQATYSAYERGRNEPPVEILVRLSYLFKCPMDVLVQRDRLYRTSDDAQQQIDDIRKQLQELEDQMTDNGGDNPTAKAFLDAMNQLADQMAKLNQNPDVARQMDEPLK